MRANIQTLSILLTATLPLTHAAPAANPPNGYGSNFKFPLANGFPNPSPGAIANIQNIAGGTLPNGPAPASPGAAGILDLQVIATNEIFEVAYFTELLYNITQGCAGYGPSDLAGIDKNYAMKAIMAVKNQEELHALGANSLLQAFGQQPIKPCTYNFPVNNFKDAIALAATFTDLVLGALQAVTEDFAAATNAPLAGLIASIVAQEGEQVGFYRYVQGKVPSSAPFLTNANGIFGYNALLQNFIVPGSCPQTLNIPTLAPLMIANTPMPKNMTLNFETTVVPDSTYYVTYVSGQNVPVSVPISAISANGGMSTFSALFPYAAGFARGLTVAALTKGNGPFASSVEVAMNSVAGPGLIEVQ